MMYVSLARSSGPYAKEKKIDLHFAYITTRLNVNYSVHLRNGTYCMINGYLPRGPLVVGYGGERKEKQSTPPEVRAESEVSFRTIGTADAQFDTGANMHIALTGMQLAEGLFRILQRLECVGRSRL